MRKKTGTTIHPRQPWCYSAFSLLELIAVIVIMGILVTIVVPRITFHTRFAKIQVCDQYRSDLDSSMEKYLFDQGMFVDNLSKLNPQYYPDVIPTCPVDGSAYTIDPVSGRVQAHTH